MYHGIINIYKEAGFTSHDVVAKLRGILGQKKIGHTGTLDPDATGVLPVCLGVGTKLCDMLTDEGKEYVAELYLGVTTDTQDMSGTVLSRSDVMIDENQLEEIIYSFVGEYEQIPPMYSALKVNGKKLYELARQGKVVERQPRRVRIDEIEILEISLPIVKMRVACSKGTYIRTLCDDIGKKAGCGGAMKSLIRSRVGTFVIEDALKLDKVEELVRGNVIEDSIIKVDNMFSDLAKASVKPDYDKLLKNGNCLELKMVNITKWSDGSGNATAKLRIYDAQGTFYGIYRYEKEPQILSPVKMFIT
ncbi:MAG: tRNA pseudouridine(55) synthase TruB [Lachnospiraceae bacterium]|nr:tRNA pseudouridine(55) synthase TruB [Lachnospiraceae bacterium]